MLYLVHFSYNTELSSDYFVFEENNYYLCPRNTVLQTSQGVLSKSENAFYVCTKRGSREITALFVFLSELWPAATSLASLPCIFCWQAWRRLILLLKTDDIHPPKTGISVHFSDFLS
jgi:hypothetical protein